MKLSYDSFQIYFPCWFFYLTHISRSGWDFNDLSDCFFKIFVNLFICLFSVEILRFHFTQSHICSFSLSLIFEFSLNQSSFECFNSQRARCSDAINSRLKLFFPKLKLKLHAICLLLQLLFKFLSSQPELTCVVSEILSGVDGLICHFLKHLIDSSAWIVIFLLFF